MSATARLTASSIGAFAVDPAAGLLTAAGNMSTEAVPSAFCLDPAGHFVFVAGTASGRLASYRINQRSGALAVDGRPGALRIWLRCQLVA
jgi:6-phosphogluconolactonase (cycloisomerase 2 family)